MVREDSYYRMLAKDAEKSSTRSTYHPSGSPLAIHRKERGQEMSYLHHMCLDSLDNVISSDMKLTRT